MTKTLAENIRCLRKQHPMTQEQLAEALGVSVGAVHKWETGRSVPNLELLLSLAEVFSVSTDVLLGYTMQDKDKAAIVNQLKDARHSHKADGALEEAEQALRRYPNHFDIVYQSAQLYYVRAITGKDTGLSRRALSLLRHACTLIDQNTDSNISILSLRINMAELHILLGEEEIALELLKKYNPMNINHGQIGYTLASSCNKPDEALPWLSEALLNAVVNHHSIVMGYVNVFMKKGNYPSALEMIQWYDRYLSGLRIPGKPSFLDKTAAAFLTFQAELYLMLKQEDDARDSLQRAFALAKEFDDAPDYRGTAVRYVSGISPMSAHDNFGSTAMEGIENLIAEAEVQGLVELWREVCREKQ
ncbi:MAG: helix-turn-helix transcriptional regulator [Ruminococcaceae bacterium]|nr:helix-turn-helix transcriptional regulator [Oscillospiraceae bacterium]